MTPERQVRTCQDRLLAAQVALAIVCFGFGWWISRPAYPRDIEVENVWLEVNGEAIHARLFHRHPRGARAAPGVVVLHGYLGNIAVMEAPFSLELAQRGFVVLALGYPGHGRSGAGIRSWRGGAQSGALQEPAVHAAVEFLRAQAGVDPDRVGLLGHSDGAKAAAIVSAADARLPSTVYIAGPVDASLFKPAVSPRNLLLVYGDRDQSVPMEPPEIAAPLDWVQRPGTREGSFVDGSARELLVLPGRDHFGILFDARARTESVAWMEAALLPGAQPTPVAPLRIGWVWLAYVGVLLGFWALLRLLERWFMREVPDAPVAAAKTVRVATVLVMLLRALLCATSGAAGTFLLLPWWSYRLEWLPISGAARVIGSFAALVTGLVVVLPLGLVGRRSPLFTLRVAWGYLRFGLGRAVLVGLLCWLFVVAAEIVIGAGYFDLVPTLRRLQLLALLASLLLPAFLLWEIWLHVVVPGGADVGTVPALLVVPTTITLTVFLLVRWTWPYFDRINVVFLALLCAFLALPLLFASHVRRHRMVMTAVVFEVLFSAWVLSVLCPFY